MSKFKIGDRVIAKVSHPSLNESIYEGDYGTVCLIESEGFIGVRWDFNVGGHSCGGRCEEGYGWKVYFDEIDFPPESEADFDIEEASFMKALVYA